MVSKKRKANPGDPVAAVAPPAPVAAAAAPQAPAAPVVAAAAAVPDEEFLDLVNQFKASGFDDNDAHAMATTLATRLNKLKEEKNAEISELNMANVMATTLATRLNKLKEEKNAEISELNKLNAEISELKGKISFLSFGSRISNDALKFMNDTTDSDAHLTTGHTKSTTLLQQVGNWIKPDWDKLGETVAYMDPASESISSEGDTLVHTYYLISSVLHALGLEDSITLHNNVTIMGVEGDIVACWKYNRMPVGSFEVKKPKARGKMKSHNLPQVDGQVFDQMHTFRLGGPDQFFSVLTTFNDWQLHSTHSLNNDFVQDVLNNWEAKLKEWGASSSGAGSTGAAGEGVAQAQVESPLRGATGAAGEGAAQAQVESSESFFVFAGHNEIKQADGVEEEGEEGDGEGEVVAMEEEKEQGDEEAYQGDEDEGEEGHAKGEKISGIVEEELGWSRTHSVSEVVSLTPDGPSGTNASRAVVNLIATALLLMLESTKHRMKKPRITNVPLAGPVRHLCLGSTTCFAFKEGKHENGIDFDTQVAANQRHFYVWFPLGLGETATCCLASGPTSGKSCVVKFYTSQGGDLAKTEERYWDEIAKRRAKASPVPGTDGKRWLLIMPYIHAIPKAERQALVEGGADGLLGVALKNMAEKNVFYKEGDIRWHHVGYASSKKEKICLCDFHDLESIQPAEVDDRVKRALKILGSRCQTTGGIYENHLEA